MSSARGRKLLAGRWCTEISGRSGKAVPGRWSHSSQLRLASGPLYLKRVLHGTVTAAVPAAADPPGKSDAVLDVYQQAGDVGDAVDVQGDLVRCRAGRRA